MHSATAGVAADNEGLVTAGGARPLWRRMGTLSGRSTAERHDSSLERLGSPKPTYATNRVIHTGTGSPTTDGPGALLLKTAVRTENFGLTRLRLRPHVGPGGTKPVSATHG